MKIFWRTFSLIIFFTCLVSLKALAIDDDGGGGIPSDVPLDGGLSLLIAAGVGYGAKKLRKPQKN